MKKITLSLDNASFERLQRLAQVEDRSQSAILRAALAAYERRTRQNRTFALTGSWKGDGTSIANVPEEQLLQGFGEERANASQ